MLKFYTFCKNKECVIQFLSCSEFDMNVCMDFCFDYVVQMERTLVVILLCTCTECIICENSYELGSNVCWVGNASENEVQAGIHVNVAIKLYEYFCTLLVWPKIENDRLLTLLLRFVQKLYKLWSSEKL